MSADEETFLDALRANSGDDDTREVYADWLEERGDVRAEYLRLEMAVHRDASRSADRRRLAKLGRQLDPGWLDVIRRAPEAAPRVNERARPALGVSTSPTDARSSLPTGLPSAGMDVWRNLDARAPRSARRGWLKSIVLGLLLALVVIEIVDFARDPHAWMSRFIEREYHEMPRSLP